MNAEYDNHFKLEFQPETSCIFVLEVSNLPLSAIFRLDIGPVPTVCYYYFFHFVLSILMGKYRSFSHYYDVLTPLNQWWKNL